MPVLVPDSHTILSFSLAYRFSFVLRTGFSLWLSLCPTYIFWYFISVVILDYRTCCLPVFSYLLSYWIINMLVMLVFHIGYHSGFSCWLSNWILAQVVIQDFRCDYHTDFSSGFSHWLTYWILVPFSYRCHAGFSYHLSYRILKPFVVYSRTLASIHTNSPTHVYSHRCSASHVFYCTCVLYHVFHLASDTISTCSFGAARIECNSLDSDLRTLSIFRSRECIVSSLYAIQHVVNLVLKCLHIPVIQYSTAFWWPLSYPSTYASNDLTKTSLSTILLMPQSLGTRTALLRISYRTLVVFVPLSIVFYAEHSWYSYPLCRLLCPTLSVLVLLSVGLHAVLFWFLYRAIEFTIKISIGYHFVLSNFSCHTHSVQILYWFALHACYIVFHALFFRLLYRLFCFRSKLSQLSFITRSGIHKTISALMLFYLGSHTVLSWHLCNNHLFLILLLSPLSLMAVSLHSVFVL